MLVNDVYQLLSFFMGKTKCKIHESRFSELVNFKQVEVSEGDGIGTLRKKEVSPLLPL